MKTKLLISATALAICISGFAQIHVTPTGTGTGSDWANATTLQNAMILAQTSPDDIWVQAGTYTLDTTLIVPANIKLLGGFPTVGNPTIEQRNYAVNLTTIENGDSAFTVIHLGIAAVLDGFIIRNGFARSSEQPSGGGVYMSVDAVVRNCHIIDNRAVQYGGGIFAEGDGIVFNTLFVRNTAGISGSAIYGTTLQVVNSTFSENEIVLYCPDSIIITQPEGDEICVNGGEVVLAVTVDDIDDLIYQWQICEGEACLDGDAFADMLNDTTHTLTISDTIASNAWYRLIVSHADGLCPPDTSDAVQVMIRPLPTLTIIPDTICGGGIATLRATGLDSDTIRWYDAGTLLHTGTEFMTRIITGNTTYYLEIVSAEGCSLDTLTPITAITYTPPQIITHPDITTRTTFQGVAFDPDTLSVTVEGSQPMFYQWYANTDNSNVGGTPVFGATGPTFEPSTTEIGEMYYYVVAANFCCDAVSDVSGLHRVAVQPIAPCNNNTPSFTLEPIYFKTNRTWVVGGQEWSDVVLAAGCNKTSFTDVGSRAIANCRVSENNLTIATEAPRPTSQQAHDWSDRMGYNGDFFNFCMVHRFQHRLCPSGDGWRVPTEEDFKVLLSTLAGSTLTNFSPAGGATLSNRLIAGNDASIPQTVSNTAWGGTISGSVLGGSVLSNRTRGFYNTAVPADDAGSSVEGMYAWGLNYINDGSVFLNALAPRESGYLLRCVREERSPLVPAAPTVIHSTTNCGAGSLTLTATPAAESDTIRWYDAPEGGTLLHTGTEFTTPIISESTIYYVEAVNDLGNVSTPRIAMRVIIYPFLPPVVAPVAIQGSNCGEGSVTLSAIPACGIVRWYDVAEGGTPLHTGNEFTTPVISESTTYYIETMSMWGCVSGVRIPVEATIHSFALPDAPVVTHDTVCSEGVLTLTATLADENDTIHWYTAVEGGTHVHTGTELITPTISESVIYYVEAVTPEGCASAPRIPVRAIVIFEPDIEQQPDTTAVQRAQNSTPFDTLSVETTGTDLTYQWYFNTTDTTDLTTATALTGNGATTNIYIPQSDVEIGDRWYFVVINPGTPCPIISDVSGRHRVNDTAGCNEELSLDDFIAKGMPYLRTDRVWRVGDWVWSDVVLAPHCADRTPADYISGSYSTWQFADCIASGTTGRPATRQNGDSYTIANHGEYRGDYFSWCMVHRFQNQLCPAPWSVPTTEQFLQLNRDLGGTEVDPTEDYTDEDVFLRLIGLAHSGILDADGDAPLCLANPVVAGRTWGAAGVILAGSPPWPYGGGIWGNTINSASSNTRYWSQTQIDTGHAQVFQFATTAWIVPESRYTKGYGVLLRCVKPATYTLPDVPTLTLDTICGSGIAQLKAEGQDSDTIRWYDAPEGGTLLHTGITFTTPTISESTTYYVEVVSDEGCVSTTRTAVTATVLLLPATPQVTAPDPQCLVDTEVHFNITVTTADATAIRWFETDDATLPIEGSLTASGAAWQSPEINATRSYFAQAWDGTCSSAERTEVVLTVNIPPVFPGATPTANEVCVAPYNGTITITPQAGLEYTIDGTSFGSNNVFTGLSHGNHTVQVRHATTLCVSEEVEIYVPTVLDAPELDGGFTVSHSTICNPHVGGDITITPNITGDNLSYLWNTGDDTKILTITTPPIVQTRYTVTITNTDNGCEGEFFQYIQVVDQASITTEPVGDTICMGEGNVTLAVIATGTGMTYQWQICEGEVCLTPTDISDETGTTLTISDTMPSDHWYRVVITMSEQTACPAIESDVVQVTVHAVPTIADISGLSITCESTELSTSIDNGVAGTIYWREGNDPDDDNLTNPGTTSPSITSSGVWHARALSTTGNCWSEAKTQQVTIIDLVPEVLTITHDTICGEGSATLRATTALGDTLRWYDASEGGTLLYTGTEFTTPTISDSTTYYVEAVNAWGCVSARTEVTAIVYFAPEFTTNPNAGTLFTVQHTAFTPNTLTATVSGTAPIFFQWYFAETQDTVGRQTLGNETQSATTPATTTSNSLPTNIIGTRYYHVEARNVCGTTISAFSGERTVDEYIPQECLFNTPPYAGGSLGTPYFKTNRVWRVGDQVWSDVVLAPGCNKTTWVALGTSQEPFPNDGDVTQKTDCRNAANSTNRPTATQTSGYDHYAYLGDYFSWCMVYRLQEVLCPHPWTVPSAQDFVALHIALGGSETSTVGSTQSAATVAALLRTGASEVTHSGTFDVATRYITPGDPVLRWGGSGEGSVSNANRYTSTYSGSGFASGNNNVSPYWTRDANGSTTPATARRFRFGTTNNIVLGSGEARGVGQVLRCVINDADRLNCEDPTVLWETAPSTAQSITQNTGSFDELVLTVGGSHSPTIEWWSTTTDDNTSGSVISGETGTSFTPPNNVPGGPVYYYAVVTSICGTDRTPPSVGYTVEPYEGVPDTELTPLGCRAIATTNEPVSGPLGAITWGNRPDIETQTITISGNGISQVWSDVVTVSNCDKDDYDFGITDGYRTDCRNAENGFNGHYFSWCFVQRYAPQLCPAPWRVPTRQDFVDLDIALHGGTGANRSGTSGTLNGVTIANQVVKYIGDEGSSSVAENWAGDWKGSRFTAIATGLTVAARSAYWSSTAVGDILPSDAYLLDIMATAISPQTMNAKQFGLALRCVRDVVPDCEDPAITTQPATDDLITMEETAFSPGTLTVAATGTAPLTYQWRRVPDTYADENPPAFDAGIPARNINNTATYTPPVDSISVWRYFVVVTNSCGTAASNLSGKYTVEISTTRLDELFDPFPDSAFLNKSICFGQEATLGWTNPGTNTYLWSTGETTSSITIPDLIEETDFDVTVTITELGTSWDFTFTVHVMVPPDIGTVTPTDDQTTTRGTAFDFPLTLSTALATPAPTIQWYSSLTASSTAGATGTSMGNTGGANSNTFDPPTTTIDTVGVFYYAVATNDCGSTTTTNTSGKHIVNSSGELSPEELEAINCTGAINSGTFGTVTYGNPSNTDPMTGSTPLSRGSEVQIWSDVVLVSNCADTNTWNTGNTITTCRNAIVSGTNNNNFHGHYFSWCFVMRYAERLCPPGDGWRVPTAEDFRTLHFILTGTTTIGPPSEGNYIGTTLGQIGGTWQSRRFSGRGNNPAVPNSGYWTASNAGTTITTALSITAANVTHGGFAKETGFALRCVRNVP
ncbi:MAG: hypothetical protein FWG79_00470 [Bacteroidales bacterium]|nr:hypothetical protein [Bacteroidales bacterium]